MQFIDIFCTILCKFSHDILHFSHYQNLFQNRAHMCNIYPMFWYFRNKDHWWGLRSESKRLKVCNFLSYHFWTLKLIINNNIVWNYYLRVDTSPILSIIKLLFIFNIFHQIILENSSFLVTESWCNFVIHQFWKKFLTRNLDIPLLY